LIKKFKDLIGGDETVINTELSKKIYEAIRNDKSSSKTKLAIDLLLLVDTEQIEVPSYISAGLAWLKNELVRKSEN
jgi:hypothetical protein